MDPNETLRKLREMIQDEETYMDNRDSIISLFMDLDEWLSNDGMLPDDWFGPQHGPKA